MGEDLRPSAEALSALRPNELQRLCEDHGVATTGSKSDLVHRLIALDTNLFRPKHDMEVSILNGGAPASRTSPACASLIQHAGAGMALVCKRCRRLYDSKRFEGIDFKHGFSCPECRLRDMDPYQEVLPGDDGLLHVAIVQAADDLHQRYKLDAETLHWCKVWETALRFKLDLQKLQQWRKMGHSVHARMCRIDAAESYQQAWPDSIQCVINGRQAFAVKPPEEGHKRRDVPADVSAELHSGLNSVELFMKDLSVHRFVFALVRVVPRNPQHVRDRVMAASEAECKQRVSDLLTEEMKCAGEELKPGKKVRLHGMTSCYKFNGQMGQLVDFVEEKGLWSVQLLASGKRIRVTSDKVISIEDVLSLTSDYMRLVCPISLERIKTPARGWVCTHLQCFDLEAFLTTNYRMDAINNRWSCPICNVVLKPPEDLCIDRFVRRILRETTPSDVEVFFDRAGAWSLQSKEPSNPEALRLPQRRTCETGPSGAEPLQKKLHAEVPSWVSRVKTIPRTPARRMVEAERSGISQAAQRRLGTHYKPVKRDPSPGGAIVLSSMQVEELSD